MKYQFIDTYRSAFAVEKMCRALKVSKSGYYAWRVRPKSKRARENEQLDHHIKTVYRKNRGTYGSPRITEALKKKSIACSENRVAKRMRINGIKAKTKKRFKVTTDSKHNHPVAENLLSQHFEAQRPNQVWVSDITYIWTHEGWLYLAVIVDLFSRQIVGWAMSNRLGQELVLDAFKQATWRRRPQSGVIFHSDQGVQYACQAFRNLLEPLKTELIYFENYITREDAKNSVFEYIEIFYNRDRMHSTLNYYSPVQFEQLWIDTKAA
jgi:transposase InsO family protein